VKILEECVEWEKDNSRFKVPTAQNEVKAAMSEVGCSRNKFKLHRRTTANGARVEAEKARNETK
jgi:hypothetical protein